MRRNGAPLCDGDKRQRTGKPDWAAEIGRQPRPDGRSYAEQIEFVPDRPGHDRRYAIDCTKIRRELGWQPAESFESGLAKTVDWYLAHRPWCAEITAQRYARERLGQTA